VGTQRRMDKGGAKSRAKQAASRLDDFQQRHPQLGYPIAVYRKYSDDQGGNLANLLAYWAFFSLFPLLLVAVTIMGFVGVGNGEFKAALSSFPLIGAGINSQKGLTGSPVALVVGVVAALWSGLSVFNTAQTAFDSVWEIPMADRPNLVNKLVRSLKALTVLGVGFIVTLGLSGIATGGKDIHVTLPLALRAVVGLITIALDVLGCCLAYTFLTKRDLTFRQVLPGAAFAGVLYFILQLGGTALVSHGAHGHTGATASVATVLGVLWWFSLQAQVVIYGAEINVVKVEQLWPRGLVDAPDTEADRRAYEAYARERTYLADESVESSFADETSGSQPPIDSGAPRGENG
jgi:membrane protein